MYLQCVCVNHRKGVLILNLTKVKHMSIVSQRSLIKCFYKTCTNKLQFFINKSIKCKIDFQDIITISKLIYMHIRMNQIFILHMVFFKQHMVLHILGIIQVVYSFHITKLAKFRKAKITYQTMNTEIQKYKWVSRFQKKSNSDDCLSMVDLYRFIWYVC